MVEGGVDQGVAEEEVEDNFIATANDCNFINRKKLCYKRLANLFCNINFSFRFGPGS